MNRFLRSFSYACTGIATAFKSEANMRIHAAAALLVIVLGFIFSISPAEWLVILLCIGLVVAAEIFNTAIEKTCDAITTEKNEHIKKAKDLAAAAVLILALISLVCGGIIFLPHIFRLFNA